MRKVVYLVFIEVLTKIQQ